MNVEIHRARDGVAAQWLVADETLHIYLNDDLDEVTRQRYITEAKAWANNQGQHRYRRLPLLLPVSQVGHLRSAIANHPAVAGAGVIAAAAGITAAVTLPAVLNEDNSNTIHRHRPAVAAPPTPGPDGPVTADPAPPHAETTGDQAEPQTRAHETARKRSSPTSPVAGLVSGQAVKVPPVALPPPISAPTGGTLKVDVPPLLKVTIRSSPQPNVRIRLGAKQP